MNIGRFCLLLATAILIFAPRPPAELPSAKSTRLKMAQNRVG